jgi:osmoprotectant transport system substrate-binding protein
VKTFGARSPPVWIAVGCLFLVTGCTAAGNTARSDAERQAVTIGSFDFPESALLAQLYGGALRANGYPVRILTGVGSRELLQPSLRRGLVHILPEYAGSALNFLTLGASTASADVGATHRALRDVLARSDLVPLEPAPAQDANAIVVTRSTAERYGLATISDLALVAPRLRFGGPSECPARPFCLAGLTKTYGVAFREFIPLDTGGPLTRQALIAEQIDVALMFTSDPNITKDDLVALVDDRHLQPAENVTPIVRRDSLDRFGPAFASVIDGVSARLTTETLRDLNGLVSFDGRQPASVARDWLRSQGLAR